MGVRCPLCGRSVGLRDARRCMGCAKVVCLECFDISMGVCVTCWSRFSKEDSCPDYIR